MNIRGYEICRSHKEHIQKVCVLRWSTVSTHFSGVLGTYLIRFGLSRYIKGNDRLTWLLHKCRV